LGSSVAASGQKFGYLGDFPLENGQVIRDCRVGYRTFGRPNADTSNAVLFPTWFGGRSRDLRFHVRPGGLIDSSRYFIIAADALGNGVSSSPSNSKMQPGRNFPEFTIRDMVRSQYRLLTEILGIRHLYAVIGGSMGGMQIFRWIVDYPDFMDFAISYVGSPRLASPDILLWTIELRAIELASRTGGGPDTALPVISLLQSLLIRTPNWLASHIPRERVQDFITRSDSTYGQLFHPWNWAAQIRAMLSHDVSLPYGSLESAARRVRAKVLVIVSATDHIVNPEPALKFARMIGAKTLVLENECGHLAVGCEMARVSRAIATFLKE
jgi:homoserine O-acetyltransferase